MTLRGRAWGAAALLSALLLPAGAWGYAYLCNSVDAHGNRVGDNCPRCDSTNGPRWSGRQLNWYVKRAAISIIGSDAWMAAVQASLDSWNGVTCKDFVMRDLGDIGNPDFGSNQAQQTLFWVTDQAALQQLVGADWQAILGLTLPRYYTAGDCSSRDFYDADMIMNGAAGYTWTTDMARCEGTGCISVVSTLIHELGHAFGLGHPCISNDCPAGGAIMAAIALPRMDYWQPLQDDVNGMCSLYPGVIGGLGSTCQTNDNCTTGLCLDDNGVQYCSQSCGTCPAGWACFNGTCRRATPEVGQACAGSCVNGALCLQDGESSFHCYQRCTPLNTPSGCPAGQRCYDISDDHSTGACVVEGSQQPGEACLGHFGDCRAGTSCYPLTDFNLGAECRDDTGCAATEVCYLPPGGSIARCLTTVCLQDCTTDSQCPSGQRCDTAGGSPGACLGARSEGAACGGGGIEDVCDADLQCLCGSPTQCACRRDCSDNAGVCLTGYRCSPTGDPSVRVCLSLRTEGQVCNGAACDSGLLCVVDAPNQGAHCYRDCSQLACREGTECHVYGQGTPQQFSVCEAPTPAASSSSGASGGGSTSGSGGGSGSSRGAASSASSFGGSSSGNPGGKLWGELCEFNSDCQSGICVSTAGLGRICSAACDPRLGHYDCAHSTNLNEGCTATDPNNLAAGGLCLPGAATGTKDPGAACSTAKDCKSGLCQDHTCLVWCADDGQCSAALDAQGWQCDRSEVTPGVCKPGSGGSNPGTGSTSSCGCAGAARSVPGWFALVLAGALVRVRRRRR